MELSLPLSFDHLVILLLSICMILLMVIALAVFTRKPRHNSEDQNALMSQLIAQQGQMMQQLHNQAHQQNENLGQLNERLGSIRDAQSRLDQLGQDVIGLQDILSNKQARGHFGESQMMDLIATALPPNAYQAQSTLSNGTRVDCLIHLPNPPGPIAVDAKFPLEYWRLLNNATDPQEKTQARSQFIRMMKKHLGDIADKYLIPGETAETAILFLPSEAIYADIHADMPEVIEYSQTVRVYITSPSTLMATLNTMRAILRDARLREETGRILKEVAMITQDIGRLDNRTSALKKHYDSALDDIRQIQISTQKITRRADELTEFDAISKEEEKGQDHPAPSSVSPMPYRR